MRSSSTLEFDGVKGTRGLRKVGVSLVVIFIFLTSGTSATIISYEMSVCWNAASPEGTPPWLTATIDDGDTPGDVTLTITSTNLVSTEKLGKWYLNLDPAFDPMDLIFSAPVKTGSFDDPNVSNIADAFMADGDGCFDIKIEFETADGGTRSFQNGDSVEYTISGIESLTANSFNFMSYKDGGAGEYITVAHVMGINGGSYSGWVTIPEPATLTILGIGALLARRRRV